jgi:lipopolysaccharide/colanic/teichoic acid biosynthesis glycosyltransferase
MTNFYKNFGKRFFDISVSISSLIILLPLLITIIVLVFLNFGFPVLFKQERPGLEGKIFSIYKFRTMNNKRDEKGFLLKDSLRLSRFGRILRSSSLDELPSLFNILKGDMSLVGPRPLLMEYLPLYSQEQKKRHLVKPGLTGLAQVNGRNLLSWKSKFELDLIYIHNISFKNDLVIIFKTIKKVIVREGINKNASISAEKFNGSN